MDETLPLLSMMSPILKVLLSAASGSFLQGFPRWAYLGVLWPLLVMGAFILGCNVWMTWSARPFIRDSVASARPTAICLVLGTAKVLEKGRENPHFTHRMQTAARLYHEDKVRHFLVSGDNGTRRYNEPVDMRNTLIELGVPPEAITCDYAGFRTLDSMVRAKEIFGVDELTVVSDGFHLPRAVFIGRYHRLHVQGVASEKVAFRRAARTEFREYLARVKAVLDLYLLGTGPRYLGEREPILVRRD